MISPAAVTRALIGVKRLACLEPDAFSWFDATRSGFWLSFWAAALYFPFWILMATGQGDQVSQTPFALLAANLIGYAINWLAYPLAILSICDRTGRFPLFYRYMVAYNWFQLAQIAFWIPLFGLARGNFLDPGDFALLWCAAMFILLCYMWRIAKLGLKLDNAAAFMIVGLDLGLSIFVAVLVNIVGGKV